MIIKHTQNKGSSKPYGNVLGLPMCMGGENKWGIYRTDLRARVFCSASIMRVANLLRILLLYIRYSFVLLVKLVLKKKTKRERILYGDTHENRIIMLYSFVTIKKKKILIELLQHTIIGMNNNLIPSIAAIRWFLYIYISLLDISQSQLSFFVCSVSIIFFPWWDFLMSV